MKTPSTKSRLAAALLFVLSLGHAYGQLGEGLLNYWNFEGDFRDSAAFLAGNASTAEDHGTPANADLVTIQEGGLMGKFANFDRSYIIVPDTEDITAGGESLSISAWFRVGTFDTTWQALIAHGEGSDYRIARNGDQTTLAYAGGTGDIVGGPAVNDGEWHHVVAITESGVSTSLWVDGQFVTSGGAPTIVNSGLGNLFIGENPGATGRRWVGDMDDIAFWNRPLTDTEIETIYSSGVAGTPISGLIANTNPDLDGDGLPNIWEVRFGLNPNSAVGNDGAAGDPDGDGLLNSLEYTPHGTDPTKADTDDDGLSDNVEVTVRMTNPTVPDTDRDSLLDGQEVTLGTDPRKTDTDADGVNDGREIVDGTNPLVANTGWDFQLVAYWPMDADYNSTVNGHTAAANGTEPIPFAAAKFGNGIQLDGVDQFLMVEGDENAFDFKDGQNMTVSAWFSADTIDKDWQCLIAKGDAGNHWRIHRRGGDQPPELSFSGGNGDLPRHNVPLAIGDGSLHHVVAIAEHGVNARLYLDGVLVVSGTVPAMGDSANPMRIGANPDTSPARFWTGLIDDVALWSRVLSEAEVAQIWNGGQGRSIQQLLGPVTPPADLRFTQVLYDKETDRFTLTWTSTAGATYSLNYSSDLRAFTNPVNSSIPSGGATTTFGPFANPVPGGSPIFFKAKQN